MAYTPTNWVNDSAPAINATNLNKIETGIDDAHDDLDAATDAATANRIVRRDANGRAQVADPSASGDIANKGWVEAQTVPKSLVDAKGDLLVGTGDNTVGRLPAGTDGQTIVYDSGEATGMRAADFPGGGGPVFQMAPKPGDYMSPPLLGINALFGPASSGSQYGTPIFITQTFSIDSLSLRVSTNEASTSAKILLYSSDSEGHPATLVADSGALDCSSGAFKTGTFSPVELTPGTYWGFIRTNSPGGSVRFYSINTVAMQQISSSVATPGNNGSSIRADVGSYASPNTTLSAWTGGAPDNFKCPWFLIHRVAA